MFSDARAALHAESGEECCEHADDKLQHRLHGFFLSRFAHIAVACFKGFVITCMCFSLPHPPPRPGAIGRAAIRFGSHGHAQAARLPGLSRSHSKDTAFACSQSCVLMLCVRFDAIFLKKTSATHFRRMRMPMALCGLPSGCVRDESPSASHAHEGRHLMCEGKGILHAGFMRAALWRLSLRLAQISRDELDLARREPLGCLLIALVEQGSVQGFAAVYPTHEAIYGHVGVGRGEVGEGKFLLGVGSDGEVVHVLSERLKIESGVEKQADYKILHFRHFHFFHLLVPLAFESVAKLLKFYFNSK